LKISADDVLLRIARYKPIGISEEDSMLIEQVLNAQDQTYDDLAKLNRDAEANIKEMLEIINLTQRAQTSHQKIVQLEKEIIDVRNNLH
jgi:peptidoglycan hydrolase CwlO-like protein